MKKFREWFKEKGYMGTLVSDEIVEDFADQVARERAIGFMKSEDNLNGLDTTCINYSGMYDHWLNQEQ